MWPVKIQVVAGEENCATKKSSVAWVVSLSMLIGVGSPLVCPGLGG